MKKEVKVFFIGLVAIVLIAIVLNAPEKIVKAPISEPVLEQPSPIENLPEETKEIIEDVYVEPEQQVKTATIQILHSRFEPKVLTVQPGTMVVWVNRDTSAHKIVTQDRTYIGKRLIPEETDSTIFNDVGEYEYIDATFKKMRGKIIVTDDTAGLSAITGGVVFSIKDFFSNLFGSE